MPETLVEMKNITKTFPGVKALDDAQLTLYNSMAWRVAARTPS